MMKYKLKKAKEHWDRTTTDFKFNVKCCYNCPNWARDMTLMGDYAYNVCLCKKDTMTKWDNYCDQYTGLAREENLLYCLTEEEREMEQ